MNTIDVLLAIPATEPASFNEFLHGLPEVPTESSEWAELFQQLDHLESTELVEIDRGFNNKINSLQLTEHGAQHVKEALRNGK